MSRLSSGLGPEGSSSAFADFFWDDGLRGGFGGSLLLTAGVGFARGLGSSTADPPASAGRSVTSSVASASVCWPERPNQNQPPASNGKASRIPLASQTMRGRPAYRRDSHDPRLVAGPDVPWLAAGIGAVARRLSPTAPLPEPGVGCVLITIPPASLDGAALLGTTVGRRVVERDPLDGGGVSDSEWRSTADRGAEPIPELPPEPLPDPLPAPLRVTGKGVAAVARCAAESPVRPSGVPAPLVSAADRRSEGRRGGSGRGLPAAAAVVVSQDASASATSCAVCWRASGCFSIMRK